MGKTNRGLIINLQTVGPVQHTLVANEVKKNIAWKALGYLDLAYRKRFDQNDKSRIIDATLQSLWIPTSGKGFPVDDCRVSHDWFNSERHSTFHHHSMKVRDPDWVGRNVFLEYVTRKLVPDEGYLESGENAVRFLNLATLCGFEMWKNSQTNTVFSASHYIFSRIYPPVLRGLYNVREEYPLMARKLWDMFCSNYKSWFMLFERMPDDQHLQLLLDAAVKTGLYIWSDHQDPWGIENNPDEFSFFNVILKYTIQKRYNLIMTMLRFGLMLKGKPIDWLQSIYIGLWNSHCDFTGCREFQEVLDFLFMVHALPYPSPEIVEGSLLKVLQSNLSFESRGLDVNRGRSILHELVDAYERVWRS